MLLVFGSINLDLAFLAPKLPAPGETVLGRGLLVSPGGKGANQAHAARRDGMPTTLVGAVGDDAFAAPALAALQSAGVDLMAVQRLPGATGCASIAVDDEGHNQIVVAPGVNLALRQQAVGDELLARAAALLLQQETDPDEALALLRRAATSRALKVLNNAPARPLTPEWLERLDVLIVNETEALQTLQGLAGTALDDLARHAHAWTAGPESGGCAPDVVDALATLARRCGLVVVLTLGSRGAMALTPRQRIVQAPLAVSVVDTTGAGDTFAGVLCSAMIEGRSLAEAMRRACTAAALACTRAGAQAAQPTREQIDQALADAPAAVETPAAQGST